MDYSEKGARRSRLLQMAELVKEKGRALGITRQKLPSCIALVVCPIITFYLFDAYTHNPFTAMSFKTQLLNIVFYELMGLLFFGIFKYVRLALASASAGDSKAA